MASQINKDSNWTFDRAMVKTVLYLVIFRLGGVRLQGVEIYRPPGTVSQLPVKLLNSTGSFEINNPATLWIVCLWFNGWLNGFLFLFRSMGRSVNRRVSYAADLIASNEELEFPHTKSFIAGLVFLFSAIFSFKLTGRIKMSDIDYY